MATLANVSGFIGAISKTPAFVLALIIGGLVLAAFGTKNFGFLDAEKILGVMMIVSVILSHVQKTTRSKADNIWDSVLLTLGILMMFKILSGVLLIKVFPGLKTATVASMLGMG